MQVKIIIIGNTIPHETTKYSLERDLCYKSPKVKPFIANFTMQADTNSKANIAMIPIKKISTVIVLSD